MLHHSEFLLFEAKASGERAERAARTAQLVAEARRQPSEPELPIRDVVLRLCRGGDGPALERLALLESRSLPRGSFVVAEVGGELVAAAPLGEPGPAFADPFRPTAAIVRLIELRRAQIHRAETGRTRSALRRLARA
jgi:hypothetical protein